MKRQQGFSLIELAIVLVIIGLLVGGVLVGKDLIGGAALRRQTSQLAKYNAAVNAFRDKYSGLPGDLLATTATGFGMTTRTGAAGHGDGNKLLEGCSAGSTTAGCENMLFWADLSFAKMIEGSYSGTDANVALAANDTSSGTMMADFIDRLNPISQAYAAVVTSPTNNFLPKADASGGGGGAYMTVYSDGNYNYYAITKVVSTTAAGVYTLADALTPNQALTIDTKIDDGVPLAGGVRAIGGAGPLDVAAVPGAAACVSNAASNPYNVSDANGVADSVLCQLKVKFN